MTLWIDAQVSPRIAAWIRATFGLDAIPVRELGLREAEDPVIFAAARDASAVVMTKDSDFVALVERHGPPPQVMWVTCGNTSNQALQRILQAALPDAIRMLESGEPLVEIGQAMK